MSQPGTHNRLDWIIRKSLGKLDEDWAVPPEYRTVYQSHFDQFPNDSRFLVTPDEETLTCIEGDCYEDMPLHINPGGMFDLTTYAQHILNSESSQRHVKERNLRLRREGAPVQTVKVQGDQEVIDLTEDVKPDLSPIVLDDDQDDLPTLASSASASKRPFVASAGLGIPNKRHRVDEPDPFLAENKQELAKLEIKQIRIEAQKRRLLEQAGPNQRDATFFTQLAYFETILKNIPLERAQLEAIISGSNPAFAPVPAHTPAPVAGPGPRTTELAARNPQLAAAAARFQEEEAARRKAQEDIAVRAYGGLTPPFGTHERPKPAVGTSSGWDDGDYPDEIRRYDEGLQTGDAEFSEFLVKAAAEDMFDKSSTVEDAAAQIGLSRAQPMPPSMVCKLMPHQLMGVAWMVKQEKSDSFGGILGDEMGLGKTVQTIATMTLNDSTDPKEKTTLIVAPLALLKQWEREIEDKTVKNHYRILIYHGSGKKSIEKPKHLLKYDVVITTYQTVVLEWPDEDGMIAKAKKKAKKQNDPDNWENYLKFDKKEGILFKTNFYRIILDEAQFIRNKATKVSRAVAQLDGLLRWCLTGTPITNKLEDVFPMLRFLQIKPWYNWEEFRNRCVLGDKRMTEAARRTQAILRMHLFRRTKDSTIDGKPILQLPKRNIELHVLEFSPEERSIYTSVETQSQIQFNKYLKAGTVLKNYAHVLVMLLRLRQVAFHPALLGSAFDGMHAEREKQEEVARTIAIAGHDWVIKLKKDRYGLALDRAIAEREGNADEAELEDCPICLEPATANEGGGRITMCKHIFCQPCLQEVLQAAAPEYDDDGPRMGRDQRPCPTCRQPISEQDSFKLDAFEPPNDEVERVAKTGNRLGGAEADRAKKEDHDDDGDETLGGFIVQDEQSQDSDYELVDFKGKGKPKPKQTNRLVVQDSDDDEIDQLDSDEAEQDFVPSSTAKQKGKGKMAAGLGVTKKMSAKEKARAEAKWRADQEPSTKMVWVLNEIRRMQEEDPDDKIIISCSFVTALDMVEDYLVAEGIKVVRFQGDMTADERDKSVQVLQKSKKCFCMLMSLKSGGVGLNLVRANRWISLDLAWSFAVEEQAFARVHRIGQDKEVFVNRLTISNSVEQRIGALQEHKQEIADASLGEGTGAKIGRLSVAQLAGLFGLTAEGDRIEEGHEQSVGE